jgi:pimeloyl-ACP methyl ester carboxylesterase
MSLVISEFYQSQAVSLSAYESKCLSALTLLFIHGRGSCQATWQPLFEPLKDKYHIIALDLRGHCDSPLGNADFCMNQMIADIEKLVHDRLLKKIVIVAHSMGVRIAVPYAYKHPEQIQGLVLVDLDVFAIPCEAISDEQMAHLKAFQVEHPNEESARKELKRYGFSDNIYDTWITDGRIRYLKSGHLHIGLHPYVTHLTAKFISTSTVTKEAFVKLDLNKMPTLLLKAEKKSCVTEEGLEFMQKEQPLLQFEEIKDSDHSIHKTTTAVFLDRLTNFLSKIEIS